MSKQKMRYKLSPELADGVHWTVADNYSEICAAVKEWCANAEICGCEGEHFEIETVMMSDDEVKALPDI